MEDEQDLPIDISCHKLCEWLIDRKNVPATWQKSVREVRIKIDEALEHMPPVDEVVAMLSGKYIDYFTCQKVADSLKDAGNVNQKSWFGKFTNEHVIRWQTILDDYSSENVFLGEIAQIVPPPAKKLRARLSPPHYWPLLRSAGDR